MAFGMISCVNCVGYCRSLEFDDSNCAIAWSTPGFAITRAAERRTPKMNVGFMLRTGGQRLVQDRSTVFFVVGLYMYGSQ